MSDNSSSASSNSWTMLAPEVKDSGVEDVGPLVEGLGGTGCLKSGQPNTVQPDPKKSFQGPEFTDGLEEHNDAREPPQVAPLEISEDAVLHASLQKEPSAVPVENLSCMTPDPEQRDAAVGHSESEPLLSPDIDSFSDSYTHISPAPESSSQHAALQDKEGLSQGEEKAELRKIQREESKPDVEVKEEKGNEGDGVRKRKISLLASVDHGDDDEEEEGEEEPFQPPQREDDFGFSLNKCIFGAVILLGLGTIFFSGVLLDLDDEGDADVKELKNPELQKEFMNLDASRDMSADVQPPEILERLAKENQQIAMLQAQLQEQEGVLKAAQLQVEEGTKERMRREELEMENVKMKVELDKLPVLQKEFEQENERVKQESERAKKDLEALPVMQKELELLRAQVTELTQSTDGAQDLPPRPESSSPSAGHKREKSATKGRKELLGKKPQEKVREEKEKVRKEQEKRKEIHEGKEWKKDKGMKEEKKWKEGGAEKKDRKKQKKDLQDEGEEWRAKGEMKQRNNEKERKKGKKYEDGKRWKDNDARDFNEEGGKRDWKVDGKKWKDGEVKRDIKETGKKEMEGDKWKKEKPWQLDGGRWETKEWKHSGEKIKKEKELRFGGEDWNRGREFDSNNKKERKEKNERKKDGKERDEWNGEKDQRNPKERKAWKENVMKGEKDHHKGRNGRKEREDKHWSGKEKEWPKDGDRAEEWKQEKQHKGDYQKTGKKWSKKDKASHHPYSDSKMSEEHMHDDYWAEQRDRIRHFHGSTEGCSGVTACAHAEGLTPVGQRDFQALLSAYLTKLLDPESRASKTEELNKLVGEFFTNGVFAHDKIPFSEFVEDVADILEDMAEEEKDEEMEDEMEEFANEAMEKFALGSRGQNEEKKKKETRRKRG